DDLDWLVAAQKVKEEEGKQLYLVSEWFWDDLVDSGKVKMSKDGAGFQFGGKPETGQMIYRDNHVAIVKIPNGPPKVALEPSVAISRLYPDDLRIYHIHPNHLRQLIADKVKVKVDEIDRVFVIYQDNFDSLVDDTLIERDGDKFVFYRKLIRG